MSLSNEQKLSHLTNIFGQIQFVCDTKRTIQRYEAHVAAVLCIRATNEEAAIVGIGDTREESIDALYNLMRFHAVTCSESNETLALGDRFNKTQQYILRDNGDLVCKIRRNGNDVVFFSFSTNRRLKPAYRMR